MKNPQYDFPKMRGGVKGRLELFRKFIGFSMGGPSLQGAQKELLDVFILVTFVNIVICSK